MTLARNKNSDSGPRARFKSELDFSDSDSAFFDHIQESKADVADIGTDKTYPSQLRRNLSERTRLQDLHKAAFSASASVSPPAPVNPSSLGIGKRLELWLINEGGRQLFFGVWVFLHMLVFAFGFVSYSLSDNVVGARRTFGPTYVLARTAALVLHVNVVFILLPVCRNFISILRRTPLNAFIPFDRSIAFHKAAGWSIVTFTLVHIIAHMVNFIRLASTDPSARNAGQRIGVFLQLNFATGPGLTGWLMTLFLGIIVFFASEKRRRENYEWFWYSHHLFIPFFVNWQLHGMFCMIKPDRPPFCSWNTVGVFWRFWFVGGVIWVIERILREVRSRHITYISKVIQHPSNVVELQIKKEKTTVRAGQYIFISCPEVSYFQWHPFTLTSSPEEDYLSVHIRVVGDFTRSLAKAVGCDFDSNVNGKAAESRVSRVVRTRTNPPNLNATLPRVMVDGPFGSASEDYLKYETVLLVGAGIGVSPFASILKSIWYRMNYFNHSKPTRLSKVYFTWIIRDFDSAEWFHSLLHAIEEQDIASRIEISIYLTGKVAEDDLNNIMVQDVGADKDVITLLRAPTYYGRPNWDKTFSRLVDRHPETDVGVFYCGPPVLSKELHAMCNKWSDPLPRGTRFFYGKESF